jgi:DNA-binding NarL/FixJ family response regulator
VRFRKFDAGPMLHVVTAISTTPPLRIVVVDDHCIVREGLMALLDRQQGMKVVGSAATGKAAILAAERLKPDVIIMDLVLPDLNGIVATQHIVSARPLTCVIALSASHTIEHVYRALRAGARGYVVKDAKGAELVQAVRCVTAGKQFLSSQIAPLPNDDLLQNRLTRTPLERSRARSAAPSCCGGHQRADRPATIAVAQDRGYLPRSIDGQARRRQSHCADPLCD